MQIIFCFIFGICSLTVFTQNLIWNPLCKLDPRLESCSGLTSLNGGHTFWTHADNNSPAELYEIDAQCNVLRTLKIIQANKRDWEEITTDFQGNLYLGDFGNNNNNRLDQRIYILRNVDQLTNDSIVPEIIQFSYGNQTAFPPAPGLRNFDMEAMVWYDDSLHLFSKNRTDPFTGYTYQYSLPAQAGSYTLFPVDSFKTGNGPMLFFWITAAAVNLQTRELILLSHDRMWLFDQFQGSRFLQGKFREIILPSYTQKEAIFGGTDGSWFITDEYNGTIRLGGNLYHAKVESISDSQNEEKEGALQIWPNPLRNTLEVLIPHFKANELEQLDIMDLGGKCLIQFTIDQARMHIPLDKLSKGLYILRKTSGDLRRQISKPFFKSE